MTTTTDLSQRVALVTGAGKGIGAGIARSLAEAGARVAVNYAHGADTAEAVAAQIRAAGGEARAFQADIAREDDVTRLFAEVRDAYGAVDVLVNNAGVWHFQPLLDTTVEEYHRHYDTNVLGNLLVTREFARQPLEGGGVIINLTSVGIGPAGPGTSLYTGTKMAIAGMTRVFAVELAPRRIRVNAIAAGLVDTEGTRASGFIGSDVADQLVQRIPLQAMGQPADIASVATFLASDQSRYVTGQVLFVDGGLSLL